MTELLLFVIVVLFLAVAAFIEEQTGPSEAKYRAKEKEFYRWLNK